MKVSSNAVKKFLLDVIQQSSFPGHMVEFVAAAKQEVANAEIETLSAKDTGPVDSARKNKK